MSYNKKRHKELLIRSENLKKEGKELSAEENSELLKYSILVEQYIFWSHRDEFLVLRKNLIT